MMRLHLVHDALLGICFHGERLDGRFAPVALALLLLLHLGENLVSQACKGAIDHDKWFAKDARCDAEPSVGEQADTHPPRDTEYGHYDRDGPLVAVDANDTERGATEVGDSDLGTDHDDVHGYEVVVLGNADEDVEFVVEAAVVVLVEDLEPHEHVEDDGAHFVVGVGQEFGTCEV